MQHPPSHHHVSQTSSSSSSSWHKSAHGSGSAYRGLNKRGPSVAYRGWTERAPGVARSFASTFLGGRGFSKFSSKFSSSSSSTSIRRRRRWWSSSSGVSGSLSGASSGSAHGSGSSQDHAKFSPLSVPSPFHGSGQVAVKEGSGSGRD